tara:strand:- start:3979 stop:4653 length:675 start_codon:yes stop_codon:yes gene_type:complete
MNSILVKQKKIFLDGEGDNWFLRNKKHLKNRAIKKKIIIHTIQNLIKDKNKKKISFLEVGCSNGSFLLQLKKKIKNCKIFGIDPSKKAIQELKRKKVKCYVGTADHLPFNKNSIDVIYYGFCLYLCDPQDYKNIYLSANRVLKKDGYIIIFDFFSKKIKRLIYKYDKRVTSIKQDFRKIFRINNKYKCIHHNVFNYSKMFKVKKYKKNDLLSISVMKNKNYKND